MNIAVFTNSYSPNIGGVELFLSNLIKEFKLRGNKVVVFSNDFNKKWKEEVINGVKVYKFPMLFASKSVFHNLMAIRYYNKVKKILKNENIKVINSHMASAPNILAVLYKNQLKIPVVSTLHGYDIFVYGKINKLTKNLVKYSLLKCDKVIGVSKNICGIVKKDYGINSVVIQNGVNLKKTKKEKNREIKLITVRRLVEKNGIDLLIRAFDKIKNKKIKLTIVGIGPLGKGLKNLVKNLKLEKKVIFTGNVSEEEKINLLSNSDCFVLPTTGYDCCSLSLLEAISIGLPVIATKNSNASEFVKCLEIKDEYTMASAILEFCYNKKLRKTLEKESIKASKNFKIKNVANEYLKLFKEIKNG